MPKAKKIRKPLTRAQAAVYETLLALSKREGYTYSPSLQEIAEVLHLSITTITAHIDNLAIKGYVRREKHMKRAIEILTEVA